MTITCVTPPSWHRIISIAIIAGGACLILPVLGAENVERGAILSLT